MDSGSSCEIIYEQCFKKLNPTIKATGVDLKTPLVGFLGERSWSVGDVPLEITIGDAPLSRTKTLNFVIVRSDSSHNMLLGRTAMQRMGILVSTIHGAIKFHTEKGIRTVFLTDEADKGAKRAKKIPATNEERILSCVNAEEKIIINDKYIKPIKKNKRGLGPDRNMAACKEMEELTKAWILRKGHLITKHGIKANPSKVKAVTDLDQPRTLKDIQSLNGKLAALSRFLSKGTEQSLAFFKVLKGCKDKKSIQWTTKADKALEKIKKLVESLPTLTAPKVGETLTMHLVASKESISIVLVAKRNEGWMIR
ncbi:reverse transcriptase domain-containing protein [Tanacetum coccineum]